SSDAVMASATWGRNMFPYWELDSPYSLLLVKMVLAAGKVTSTMPCTSPAALTIVRSVLEAIWPSRDGYFRMLTARAITSPKMTREVAACMVMAALAQRASGITSVGLNAVALVKPRTRQSKN